MGERGSGLSNLRTFMIHTLTVVDHHPDGHRAAGGLKGPYGLGLPILLQPEVPLVEPGNVGALFISDAHIQNDQLHID